MNLGLEFLLRLSELCRQELSQRGLKDSRVDSGDPVPFPRSCGSYRAESRSQSNLLVPKNCAISKVIPDMPMKNLEEVSTTANPANSTSESKEYHCAECNYFATSRTEYITHALSCGHVGLVKCLHCTEFVIPEELDNHIKSTHLTPDIFERQVDGLYHCTKCNQSWKYLSLAKKHVTTLAHQGMDRCHACGVVLSLKELKIHLEEIHGKTEDNWACKICGLQYSSKMCLDRHITSVHERKETFKCTECTLTFTRSDALRKHQSLHSDIRPFACCFCELSFKLKETLKGHMYNIHFKNRYQCQICYRSFNDQNMCDSHVKAYHEGIGYLCMVCGQAFTTYSKRERHFTIHLRARKNRINMKRTSSSEEVTNSDPNLYEKENQLLKAMKREHSQNHQKPLVESDNLKSKTNSSKSKKNMEETQVTCSTSRKRKIDVRKNCDNETFNLSGAKRRRGSKNVVSEMSTCEADQKCDRSSKSDLSASDSNLVIWKSDRKESFHESNLNGAYKPTSGRATNASKLIRNSSKEGVSGSVETVTLGTEQASSYDITGEERFCKCPDDVSACIGGEAKPIDSVYSLRSCSTMPEKTLFININNLPGVDSTIDSFSSFRPDSSITESTLFIDVNNIPQYESIDIIDLSSVDVQGLKVETDDVEADALADIKVETGNVAPFWFEGISSENIKVETDSGLSLYNAISQDVPPLIKVPVEKKDTKKSASQQKSKRRSKSLKYRDSGKKVIVRNLITNDDDFVLPEFVLEEDDE